MFRAHCAGVGRLCDVWTPHCDGASFFIVRTTLTLEADVAERLRQELAGGRRTLKEVINEGLRQGLQIKQPTRRKSLWLSNSRPNY